MANSSGVTSILLSIMEIFLVALRASAIATFISSALTAAVTGTLD